MAPHTTFSVRKLILRFFQRGKTQREIADLTDTSMSSLNRTIVNFQKNWQDLKRLYSANLFVISTKNSLYRFRF